MAILNVFALLFFSITRIVIFFGTFSYRVIGGLLRFVWIPVKGMLYALGFCFGIGLVIGTIVFLANGGHLKGKSVSPHPGCRNITAPAAVCLYGGKVVRVVNGR